ncbi:MAG: RNA-binding protein [Firmicutes bacterium]|jgi:ribosomal protein L14E/L6E/L27E|nr:RNA-binding protein [Bacillota bacterium]
MLGTVKPGQLVRSRAGRDEGVCYLVLGYHDARRVRVTDGARRPVTRPKIKNLSHLEIIEKVGEDVAAALAKGEPVTDAMVRKNLAAILEGGR